MYDIDHEKPLPKYPDPVGSGKLFTEMEKKKLPVPTWVSVHGVTKVKDVKKAEHFLEQLHAEQVAETVREEREKEKERKKRKRYFCFFLYLYFCPTLLTH